MKSTCLMLSLLLLLSLSACGTKGDGEPIGNINRSTSATSTTTSPIKTDMQEIGEDLEDLGEDIMTGLGDAVR